MIQVKQDDRISIDEVLNSPLLEPVKTLKTCPKLDQKHTELKEIITDFLKRGNVYKFSGKPEFDTNFEQTRQKFDMNDSYWADKVQHMYEHALLFIFDIDPSNDKIEAVKLDV
jgi:hypothetical protein